MDRQSAVDTYAAIQYLREIAAVAYRHQIAKSPAATRLLLQGARYTEIRGQIAAKRKTLRYVNEKPPRDSRIANRAQAFLDSILGNKRVSVYVYIGKPHFKRVGLTTIKDYRINVGYMYADRVIPLIRGLPDTGPVPLSAEKLRVNDRTIDIYECLCIGADRKTEETHYLAISKARPGLKALGRTPAKAINAVQTLLSKKLDAIVLNQED